MNVKSNRPIPSYLLPLYQNESKCENEFRTQVHFHANQSHFHKNGFALRLVLKQGTRELGNGLLLHWLTAKVKQSGY